MGAGKTTMLQKSYVADVAVPQYTGVIRSTSDGHATVPSANNQVPLGVVDNDEQLNPGYNVAVKLDGVAELIAASGINYGDYVVLASGGQALSTRALASGTVANVLGFAENSVTAAGDYVYVIIKQFEHTVGANG